MAEYSRPPGLKADVVDRDGRRIREPQIDRPLAPIKFPPGSECTLGDTELIPGVRYRAKTFQPEVGDVALAIGTRLQVIGVRDDRDRVVVILDDGPTHGCRLVVAAHHLRPV